MKTLGELLTRSSPVDDFLRFLDALYTDYKEMESKEANKASPPYGPAANGWENVQLDRFLEAMGAWARAPYGLAEAPSWRAFAQLLLAAKSYE
jgi:hypothetical protein